MTTHTIAHASAEVLSAYLDQELVETEATELEAHLEGCAACAERLDGLRQVVSNLRHLERMAPSSTLDQLVARRVALASGERSMLERVESSLGSFQRQSSIFMLFCVVIALAVITLLFAHALEKARNSTIPVVFEDPAVIAGDTDIPSTEAGVPPAADTGPGGDVDRLQIGGWSLVRRGPGWAEEGLTERVGESPVFVQLRWESQAAQDLLAEHPDLELLRQLDDPVLVEIDGRPVALE